MSLPSSYSFRPKKKLQFKVEYHVTSRGAPAHIPRVDRVEDIPGPERPLWDCAAPAPRRKVGSLAAPLLCPRKGGPG